ncbi:hypothetical protein [Methanobrevibacter sp.]|uniref:hypothetical protein n=1 Tax=Methanobrevibacter sp. TaxID=66852 RepID=UPI003D7C8B38
MQMIWFYVAVVLAISDILHTTLMWKVLNNFYILLGVFIQQSTHSSWQTWLIHETMEAAFHFVILSVVFLNPIIGLLAALIHFIIDICHTVLLPDMGELEHRALHFVIESLFFMIIYGL